MQCELLGAVDVEVAVGRGRGVERARDLGGEVLGAHRMKRPALAAERDNDRALDVARQRVREVGRSKERVGNARALDRLLGGELGTVLDDLRPVLHSHEAPGEVTDPVQPVSRGCRRDGRGAVVLDRFELRRVLGRQAT